MQRQMQFWYRLGQLLWAASNTILRENIVLRVGPSLLPLAEVMSVLGTKRAAAPWAEGGWEGAWAQQGRWACGGATRYQDFKAEEQPSNKQLWAVEI